MAELSALLRIIAKAEGKKEIENVAKSLGDLKKSGDNTTKALEGIASSASGLAGSMRALIPLLSGAGLMALAQKSIETGDHLWELSERTGISVERLSQLSKAAKLSGTDIDSVAMALQRMSRSMVAASDSSKELDAEGLNTSKAAAAYRELGIAVRDSQGQLRSSGDVLLDVANKFQSMANGVDKAALAQQLFGRGGAELIPLLNMGGEEISKFKGMTTAQAKASDELSDAMTTLQGKVGGLGGKLAMALMPSLEKFTNNLTGLIDAFNKLDPQMQTFIGYGVAFVIAWGPLAGIIINTAKAVVLLQGGIALLAGGGIGTAVAGGLAALIAIITGPVGIIAALVLAGVAIYAFRRQILDALLEIGDAWNNAFKAIIDFSVDIFNKIKQSFIDIVTNPFEILFNALIGNWSEALIKMAGLALKQFKGIGAMIGTQLKQAFAAAADVVQGIWNGMLQGIRNAINSIFSSIGNTINSWINSINNIIRSIASATKTTLPQIPSVPIPQFASGAYVTGPTLAQVGEGGQPEYVIPSSRMAAASAAYLGGARGVAVLNGSASGSGRPVVNITTGPVMQQADGSRWVSLDDAAAMVRQAVDQLRGELAQPSARAAMGVG